MSLLVSAAPQGADAPVGPESNPNHHLWNNHGTWFCAYTVHRTPFTKERVRHSLKTNCVVTARHRRDLILARLEADGIIARTRRRPQ